MAKQTAVASRMFRALADAGVNIQMITTSEIKISVLVSKHQSTTALAAVHQAFALHQRPADAKSWHQIQAERKGKANADELVNRLREDQLEALTLTGISSTEAQARVTLRGVPDRPGIAADMFEKIGAADIFVDMIVQGYDGVDGSTSVSFTICQHDLPRSLKVAEEICRTHGMRDVQGVSDIAKITVSGIGLRSHTHVATAMFQQLAAADINVEMISTSELQVNTVIAAGKLAAAMQGLRAAFAEAL
jgi:aspartate kinase